MFERFLKVTNSEKKALSDPRLFRSYKFHVRSMILAAIIDQERAVQ